MSKRMRHDLTQLEQRANALLRLGNAISSKASEALRNVDRVKDARVFTESGIDENVVTQKLLTNIQQAEKKLRRGYKSYFKIVEKESGENE